MAKQKFELSSSIISQEVEKNSFKGTESLEEKPMVKTNGKYPINFLVTQEFKGEFKSWCARKNLTMASALHTAFILLKNKYGD